MCVCVCVCVCVFFLFFFFLFFFLTDIDVEGEELNERTVHRCCRRTLSATVKRKPGFKFIRIVYSFLMNS